MSGALLYTLFYKNFAEKKYFCMFRRMLSAVDKIGRKGSARMSETVRERLLARERETLSPFAFLTENTRGREHPIGQAKCRTLPSQKIQIRK